LNNADRQDSPISQNVASAIYASRLSVGSLFPGIFIKEVIHPAARLIEQNTTILAASSSSDHSKAWLRDMRQVSNR
jgi:hypothetical protein